MMREIIYSMVLFIMFISCGGGSDGTVEESEGVSIDAPEEWLIPLLEIKDGGPGKDGIPSIDSPKFIENAGLSNVELHDNTLVVGIVIDGVAKAYPHYILDWHELVNDEIGNKNFALSYCPLTGTAFAWSGKSGGVKTTYGVSGLLYNANLILYDRRTEGLWSQLKLQCVNGSLIGETPEIVAIVETNWKTWKTLYPETMLLSEDTGYSRTYGVYPYGTYKEDHEYFIFRASPRDNSLPSKTRVYSILDDEKSKVYKFEDFKGGKAVTDTFNGSNYVIVGNEKILNSFKLSTNQVDLEFEYELSENGGFFRDSKGTIRSVFGTVVSGESMGDYLTPSVSVTGYWFSIAAFYPDPIIY